MSVQSSGLGVSVVVDMRLSIWTAIVGGSGDLVLLGRDGIRETK